MTMLLYFADIMKGVDQRLIDEIIDEEISIGDFVLTGGEIAAMAVVDAVARLIPGVLKSEEGFFRTNLTIADCWSIRSIQDLKFGIMRRFLIYY